MRRYPLDQYVQRSREKALQYVDNEKRTNLKYAGSDPRVHGGAQSYRDLIECLCRAGEAANLREQSEAEQLCFLRSCEAGWRLDAEAFAQSVGEHLGGGNEHDVFLDEPSRRVIKVTTSATSFGAQGSLLSYLVNFDRCNRFFGDAVRFEGFLPRVEGEFSVVVSQPMVLGRPATMDEIQRFFGELDFVPAGPHAFERRNVDGRDYFVADARPDNVITHPESGLVCPIDVHIIVTESV